MNTATSILEPEAYAHVFETWRGATALEFWGDGNVGDQLIRRGAERLYQAYGIRVTDDPAGANVVFYGGGGNMGPMYPGTKFARSWARGIATRRRLPLIVLPQTWTGPEDFAATQFFAREKMSLKYCPSAILAPDLGLAYLPDLVLDEPRHEIGRFMRKDGERSQSVVPGNCGDPALMARTAEEYVRLASLYRVIHTDRLHFAIASMIAGREVHLYANSYFKNEAVCDLWLRERGCFWAGAGHCRKRADHER